MPLYMVDHTSGGLTHDEKLFGRVNNVDSKDTHAVWKRENTRLLRHAL